MDDDNGISIAGAIAGALVALTHGFLIVLMAVFMIGFIIAAL